ncbi:hypothetical protein ACIBHX_47075 [Nonomuraea sp. NPDC050536]|uniref:hypothetical protein n=1 Tax=Nonomuraea sp. NPDC050536 TaxID=3364366 RepID=UPI0037C96273
MRELTYVSVGSWCSSTITHYDAKGRIDGVAIRAHRPDPSEPHASIYHAIHGLVVDDEATARAVAAECGILAIWVDPRGTEVDVEITPRWVVRVTLTRADPRPCKFRTTIAIHLRYQVVRRAIATLPTHNDIRRAVAAATGFDTSPAPIRPA